MATDPPTRAERARQTRRRMVASARDLFVEQGYAATTVAQIAEAAGVAEQTIYYTFRTKGQLLVEVVETTAAGHEDPDPVPRRAWFQEVLATEDAHRVVALTVEHGTGIYERVAVLWPATAAAAATDPEVAEYWDSVSAGRRDGQRRIVARIAELGALRPSLDVEAATDVHVVLAGHDPYRALVQDAGWPVDAYKAWLFSILAQQLLVDPTPEVALVEELPFTRPGAPLGR